MDEKKIEINFSKCCGGNDETPQEHCQDCPEAWKLIKKPYTQFIEAFCKAGSNEKRAFVLRCANDYVYGGEVHHSIFGIGDFDPSYDLTPERVREIKKLMKFYATLEK
jgi:hypothetical protein